MKAKPVPAKAKPEAARPALPTATVAPQTAAPQVRRYFVSAPVDFAMIGGLSILTFLGLRLLYSGERTSAVISLAVVGMWICNWPHFAATSYRLYHSRDNIRQYPMTALVIPWLIVIGVMASFAFPSLVAPYFIKIFLIWSPYHFSGQSIGITLIYARRNGFVVGRWERLALSTFIFGTFVTQTLRAEVGAGYAGSFFGIPTPILGLPAWTLDASMAAMAIAALVFLGFVIRWSLQHKRVLSGMVLLPAVTQYVWFVHSTDWLSFQEFVPFFHSLQYMFIAWCMQLKEKMDLRAIAPSRRYVLTESARWGIVVFAVGALLFFALPRAVNAMMTMPGPHPLLFATGVIVAAVQIHHFFVDGVIWKLKRKSVSSPLMVNLDDLIGPVPAVSATSGKAVQAA